jgi:SAM-dependent methyltransferase
VEFHNAGLTAHAASGAVQIPEYVRFSDHYELCICVDLSVGGLIEAKRRLGSRAVCILADITQLPFADEAMDAFVSLHTIYHIPVDEQSRAIAELYRTLQSGGRGVVVYSWGGDAPLLRWYRHWVLRRKAALTVMASGEPTEAMPDLYFHPQNYAWYRREIAAQYPVKLRVWRSVERDFLETIIRSPVAALMWLWPLYLAEQLFPAWFGRIGICPMFVFNKPLR